MGKLGAGDNIGVSFHDTMKSYEESKVSFLAGKGSYNQSNVHLHLSSVLTCLLDGADILLMNPREQRELLLPQLFAENDRQINEHLSNIRCNSFLSISSIGQAGGISERLGLNVFIMRKELEHKSGQILHRQPFQFTHLFHFMAASVLNLHFVPIHLQHNPQWEFNADYVTEYNKFDIVTRTSYQFIGLLFVERLISIGVELEHRH